MLRAAGTALGRPAPIAGPSSASSRAGLLTKAPAPARAAARARSVQTAASRIRQPQPASLRKPLPPPSCAQCFSTTPSAPHPATEPGNPPASSSASSSSPSTDSDGEGPTARYDALVHKGILTDDAFQRHIIAKLQVLHDSLRIYAQKPPSPPSVSSARLASAAARGSDRAVGVEAVVAAAKPSIGGIFRSLFGGRRRRKAGEGGEDDDGPPTLASLEGKNVPQGMYLYGDVGTGKSMLMDLFFDTLPSNIKRKRRIHFHQFMIDVHKRSHYFKSLYHRPSGMVMSAATAGAAMVTKAVGGSGEVPGGGGGEIDPIDPVAREIANECEVLCFDEFQVTDIADAMILRRLLEQIIAYGVVCVMTSNRHPKDLYKNGIQRSSFLPCIDLLQSHFTVVDLDSGTDYRKVPKALSKVYFSSERHEDLREYEKIWAAMTEEEAVVENRKLKIWGRNLLVPQSTSKVARFTFMQLCGSPKSAADYIEICRRFHTVFIDEVPRMGVNQRDLARRFITFIDSVYESKTKLIVNSEVPILHIFSADAKDGKPTEGAMRSLMDDLGLTMDDIGGNPIFTGEEELFAFARVISRLSEMNTVQYAQTLRMINEAPPEA